MFVRGREKDEKRKYAEGGAHKKGEERRTQNNELAAGLRGKA